MYDVPPAAAMDGPVNATFPEIFGDSKASCMFWPSFFVCHKSFIASPFLAKRPRPTRATCPPWCKSWVGASSTCDSAFKAFSWALGERWILAIANRGEPDVIVLSVFSSIASSVVSIVESPVCLTAISSDRSITIGSDVWSNGHEPLAEALMLFVHRRGIQ
jgi:hypothetical protein